jgi:hypothetical protein
MAKRMMQKIKSGLLPSLVLFFVLSSCQWNQDTKIQATTTVPAHKPISDSKIADSCISFLSNGCIVLRRGNDVISDMFSQFNRTDKTYSHCGIAFKENEEWYVYHSIGGEDNPDAVLRKEPFATFVRRECNHGFGIGKVLISEKEANQVKEVVYSFYNQKIPFDMQFDLSSDDRLYCAEMIFKAFTKGLHNTHFFPTTQNGRFQFVSTDNIFVNNKVTMLCRITY